MRSGCARGSVLGAALACVALLFTAPATAHAASIEYRAIDLPDATPGEDLWEYRYTLSGVSLLSGQGFDVYFAVANGFLFRDLVDPQLGPSSDWDVLAIQPDPGLSFDGLFDAVALVDAPSLSVDFISTFIWGGTGTPGAQRFEVFDEQLQVIESGTTTFTR